MESGSIFQNFKLQLSRFIHFNIYDGMNLIINCYSVTMFNVKEL